MPKRKLQTEALAEEVADTANWSEYTVAELKLELEARGLSKGGRKDDLIGRLEASDNGTLPTDEPAPKLKRAKKAPSPEVEIEGPLASDVVQYQTVSRSGERRLRPFEAEPDETYKKKLKKIRKERMFMLDRNKSLDRDGFACEIFDIAGSSGNIYQTTIGRKPNCTCMDAVCLWNHIERGLHTNLIQRIRGQKCKHICCMLSIPKIHFLQH
jgi:SAP domain